MKLYYRSGKLLVKTNHNTLYGNSYMLPPTADRTIQDGTKGAFTRIAKELGMPRLN